MDNIHNDGFYVAIYYQYSAVKPAHPNLARAGCVVVVVVGGCAVVDNNNSNFFVNIVIITC
jgi:hypothetical protein